MNKTLLLVDGHSMAFRAFYGLRYESFLTSLGQYTNAVHGFTSTLLKLVADYKPTHVAVAFDLPGGTFRTREYTEYKGGRAATPEPFKGQIGLIQETLDVMGYSWITVEDFEADDIIATLATKGAADGMRVLVASGDKDSYQLVTDDVTVLYPMPGSQMVEMTPDAIEAKTGVRPERYSDLAALVGEGADNIPGVKGVGPKTAVKWINEYGNLDGVLEHAGDIKGKVGETLRESVEQVRLNRWLNELVKDMDLGKTWDDLVPTGVDVGGLHKLFNTLEFNALRRKVLDAIPAREGTESEQADGFKPRDAAPTPFGSTPLKAWLGKHPGPYGIAVDGQVAPARGRVDAFAIGSDDGAALFGDPTTLSSDDDAALTEFLADAVIAKVAHGSKGVRHAWIGQGKELNGVTADTEIDAYLLQPDQRGYDFADYVDREVGISLGGADSGTLDIGADGSLTTDRIGRAAIAVLDLHDVLTTKLEQEGQSMDLVSLELEVSRILGDLEDIGIAVDQERLESLRADFDARVQRAEELAHMAAGSDINLSSPKQLGVLLFEEMGLPGTKKTKTGSYTTNADALADLRVKLAAKSDEASERGVEFLDQLLEYRDATKLRQSVEGLIKSVLPDGRIHTTFQQTVAATGRLSSADPNLQNIHARTEEGRQIRSVFLPGEGYDLVMTADYSQIEMRVMAHMSEDDALIQAFNDGADLHSYVASRVFGVPEDEVSSDQRSKVKAMSYGLAYGLSSFGLSQQLGISTWEAQQLMDDYFSRFGHVRDFLKSAVDDARQLGYTQTLIGRRRYLPDLNATNRLVREAAERAALNAPIQGSAADIIKLAMVEVDAGLKGAGLKSRILLQVHDELVLEVVKDEAEKVEEIVRERMGDAFPLSVPLTVGVGLGSDWRDAAH